MTYLIVGWILCFVVAIFLLAREMDFLDIGTALAAFIFGPLILMIGITIVLLNCSDIVLWRKKK